MTQTQAPADRLSHAMSRDGEQPLSVLRWPLALIVFVAIIATAAPFWNVPLNRDQGVYATCADVLLHGGVPYRDCWDTKGPSLHYTYAVARIIFGAFTGGAYVLNALAIALTALVLAAIAYQWFARLKFAYGIGLIYGLLAIAVRFDMNAQPESFANLFAMLGLLGITWALKSKAWSVSLISGALFAFAVFYKYALAMPYAAAAIALIFLLPISQPAAYRWKVFAGTLGGAVGLVAIFSVYLLAMGALDDAVLHLNFILFYFPKAQLNPDEFALRSRPMEQTLQYMARLPIIWLLSLAGALVGIIHRRWYGWVIMAFIASGIIVVWGQQRFTPYHWTVCLPAFALTIGVLADEIMRLSSERVRTAALPVVAAAVTANIASFFYQDQWLIMGPYITGAETKQAFYETHGVWDHAVAADYIRKGTEPGDTIWIWGHHTAIYALTERMSPTRFIYNEPLLMQLRVDNPWQEQWREDALDDVYANPPVYILLTTFDRTFFDFRNPNVAWRLIPEYNELTTVHYLKEYEFGRFQFYRLIPYWSRQNQPELLDQVTVINLIDKLDEAEIESQPDPPVEVIPFMVLSEPAYDTIRIAPPGRMTFTLALPSAPACLRVDTVMYPDSWAWGGDGAAFMVHITGSDDTTETLMDETITNAPEDQHWHAHLIDLSAYSGETVRLTFETGPGSGGDFTGDWAGWGMPRIVQPPAGSVCDSNMIVDTRSK
jgi:hypothetical protein